MDDHSHLLNNSLTKIKIIYELLKDSSDENRDEYFENLEDELKKIKKVFHSLRCNS